MSLKWVGSSPCWSQLPVCSFQTFYLKKGRLEKFSKTIKGRRLFQVVDLQDKQEDRVPDGVDGGREGAQQDLPTLPTHVLATGTP